MICFKGCRGRIDTLKELVETRDVALDKLRSNFGDLLQQNLGLRTERQMLQENLKELESKLLKIEETKVNNKLSGTPQLNWELPQKPKDPNAKVEETVHTVTDLGTCYNEPCTGEPLFNADPVVESKYPAKKKK